MREGRAREEGAEELAELRSAGGVVARRAKTGLQVVLMRSRYGTWVFPKGGVEEGEAPAAV